MTSDALLRLRFPDQLVWEYLTFADMERWWSSVALINSPTIIVGTRPRRLQERSPLRSDDVMFIDAARSFNQAGITTSASIRKVADPAGVRNRHSVSVVDDILMTGRTICAALGELGRACERVDVLTFLSTDVGARRVVDAYPSATISSHHWARYEPVREGTLIFLWDLLFGNIAGGCALERRDLLGPFFGDDLIPLEELRDGLAPIEGQGAPVGTPGQAGSPRYSA